MHSHSKQIQNEHNYALPVEITVVKQESSILLKRLYPSKIEVQQYMFLYQNGKECAICGIICKNTASLHQHMEQHDPKFKCTFCYQLFAYKSNILEHISTYHSDDVYPCKFCKTKFESPQKRDKHVRETCKKRLKFPCELCVRKFSVLLHREEHVQARHEGKRYYCPIPGCNRKYQSKQSTQKHFRDDHLMDHELYKKLSSELKMELK